VLQIFLSDAAIYCTAAWNAQARDCWMAKRKVNEESSSFLKKRTKKLLSVGA